MHLAQRQAEMRERPWWVCGLRLIAISRWRIVLFPLAFLWLESCLPFVEWRGVCGGARLRRMTKAKPGQATTSLCSHLDQISTGKHGANGSLYSDSIVILWSSLYIQHYAYWTSESDIGDCISARRLNQPDSQTLHISFHDLESIDCV